MSISYDGTGFVGWQKQEPPAGGVAPLESAPGLDAPDGRVALRSVQAVVERAVREAVRQPVVVIGASRTDSGVHARCQTAAFTTQENFTDAGRRIGPADDRLKDAINARLPEDVLVTSCVPADPLFDPIKDCVCKGYRYSVRTGRDRPLWERGRVWHVRSGLDVEAMDRAARAMVGTFDFTSFAAAGHGRESAVRTLATARVTSEPVEDGATIVRIDVAADGFLWNMVRIIAGTLVEVGRGAAPPEDIPAIVAAKDRSRAGPTAPAHGLCLMWGVYPGDPPPPAGGIDPAWLSERERRALERRAERAKEPRASASGPSDQESRASASGLPASSLPWPAPSFSPDPSPNPAPDPAP